jgi:SAM-dependent methyltransferase
LKESIYSYNDLLEMLDNLLIEESSFDWNKFYAERERKVPFFVNSPDENLVKYFEEKKIKAGKVLELGCGPGRNAIYLSEIGCTVDAVDISQEALDWGAERAKEKNVDVHFINKNIFELDIDEGKYDIVYDSGCFHHIAPHRRMSYLNLINKALKPNGFFALTCFIQGGEFGGAEISDWEVYKLRSLKGGLGYTEEKLRAVFKDYKEIEIRRMKKITQPNVVFGESDLLTGLFIIK